MRLFAFALALLTLGGCSGPADLHVTGWAPPERLIHPFAGKVVILRAPPNYITGGVRYGSHFTSGDTCYINIATGVSAATYEALYVQEVAGCNQKLPALDPNSYDERLAIALRAQPSVDLSADWDQRIGQTDIHARFLRMGGQ